MPPRGSATRSSTRSRRTRRDWDTSEPAEPEVVETPTRKRKRTSAAHENESPVKRTPARRRSRKQEPVPEDETLPDHDGNDVEDEDEEERSAREADDFMNRVFRSLKVSQHQVNARTDFHNDVQNQKYPEGRSAFAKLAGRDWTYYIEDVKVLIGRPQEEKGHGDTPGANPGAAHPGTDFAVQIDLGPHKAVSRCHAEIYFQGEGDPPAWFLLVNSRNGAQVDDIKLPQGGRVPLHSGAVITIANTQMIFLLPESTPQIHPVMQQQLLGENRQEDEDEEEYLKAPPRQMPQAPPPASSPKRELPTGPYSQQYQFSRAPHGQYSEPATMGAAPGFAPPALPQTPARPSTGDGLARPKNSPVIQRGMMLETTEEIDYSADSARDIKPPYSYAQLITMAIMEAQDEKLTLSGIYDWIKQHYAYYRFSTGGWQNSIRHNLSLNKQFEKQPRQTNEPGKGMKWGFVAETRDEHIRKTLGGIRKGGRRGSSDPASPARREGPTLITNERLMGSLGRNVGSPRATAGMKNSPASTPPTNAYRSAHAPDAFTPSRSDNEGSGELPTANGLPSAAAESPLPTRRGPEMAPPTPGGTNGNAPTTQTHLASPPALPRFGDTPHGAALITPLLQRHYPRLAPPSIAQPPSQVMPHSSPAPFWKFAENAGGFGSTPAGPGSALRGLGFLDSPDKSLRRTEADNDKDGDLKSDDTRDVAPAVQSSSPPPAAGAHGGEPGSPTRGPASRLNAVATAAATGASAGTGGAVKEEDEGATSDGGNATTLNGVNGGRKYSVDTTADDDEGGIDLARGFTSIGSYHQRMSAGLLSGSRAA